MKNEFNILTNFLALKISRVTNFLNKHRELMSLRFFLTENSDYKIYVVIERKLNDEL